MTSSSSTTSPTPKNKKRISTIGLALLPVTVALVFVVTFSTANLFYIPVTKGYFDFGDVMIFIVALTLGPLFGGIAGGLGSSLSDALSSGSGVYAPFTLIIKGLEGYAVGYFAALNFRGSLALAWIAASTIMIGGYFLAESLIITGYPASLADIPVNIVQVAAAGIVGIPVSHALKNMLPAGITAMNRTWARKDAAKPA